VAAKNQKIGCKSRLQKNKLQKEVAKKQVAKVGIRLD
jgi:hypothetical protein